MAIDLHEYKTLYLETSHNLILMIRRLVAALDQTGTSSMSLSECHRAAHSLKGQSFVMGYAQVGMTAKILESLLLHAKQGGIKIDDVLTQDINSALTGIEDCIESIKNHHGERNLGPYIRAIEKHTAIRLLD